MYRDDFDVSSGIQKRKKWKGKKLYFSKLHFISVVWSAIFSSHLYHDNPFPPMPKKNKVTSVFISQLLNVQYVFKGSLGLKGVKKYKKKENK